MSGKSIFDSINGSYAHGLSFGGYRVRKYQLIFTSVIEAFAKPFLSSMKKKTNKIKNKNSHTVSLEYAGLHQTIYGE